MNFVELRTKAGLKQKDIELQLKLKPATVSKWENGKLKPKLQTLKELSQILNCELNEIIDCFNEKTKKRSE